MTARFNLIKSSVVISEKELMNVDKLVVLLKKSKKRRIISLFSKIENSF